MSRPVLSEHTEGRRKAPFLVLASLACALFAGAAAAQPARSWPEERCARYARSWSEALARFGRAGLGADFLGSHGRFLASGCSRHHDVCPRSPAERAMADAMTVAAVNSGASGSFLPFACRG